MGILNFSVLFGDLEHLLLSLTAPDCRLDSDLRGRRKSREKGKSGRKKSTVVEYQAPDLIVTSEASESEGLSFLCVFVRVFEAATIIACM